MSEYGDIQFNEEQFVEKGDLQASQGGLVGLMLRNGWAKSIGQANMYILIIAIVFFVLAIIMFTNASGTDLAPAEFANPEHAPQDTK